MTYCTFEAGWATLATITKRCNLIVEAYCITSALAASAVGPRASAVGRWAAAAPQKL